MPVRSPRRRALVLGGAAAFVVPAAVAQAPRGAARPIAIAQLHDISPTAQDVTRDFLVGARAAWQDIAAQGGVNGRPVQHLAVEVDGSAASVQAAWNALREQPACVALCGTCGDAAASHLARLLRQDDTAIAHAAPWLQDSGFEADGRSFPIFSGRQEQIAHAMKTLTVSGVRELGAVFASPLEHGQHRDEVMRAGVALGLKVSTWTGSGDLAQLGQRLGAATPALLLFVGGTPELVQFTQGLDRQSRQRYVIALAEVNLQTVQQMGGARTTPIIATQPVPLLGAALPVVRRYREVLARLFDEPPTALGLSGFIAARYSYEVLAGIDGPVTRASALAAFQRRQDVDVGGFRVSFQGRRRQTAFVTQSMLTADGRVIG